MKPEIEKFKNQLIETMVPAFEMDGQFVRTAFFLTQNDCIIGLAAPLTKNETNPGMDSLADLIREKCKDPNIKAVAVMMEINIKNPNGTKVGDGLMIVVSSIDGDDVTVFNVDCDQKKVIGLYNTDLPGAKFRGGFSGFFQSINVDAYRMTNEDFLKERTKEVIEIFESYGCCPCSFTVLQEDGVTFTVNTSYTTSLDLFNSIMRKHCENPSVKACIFVSETLTSKATQVETNGPAEYKDFETGLLLIYTTRDQIEKLHVYKPNFQGKLELTEEYDELIEEFCNPFEIKEVE
jgi:hypothetical protein